ncbi:MAG: Nif11-like leader peptide family RiPP precursor [Oscillospiraceae bacterium]
MTTKEFIEKMAGDEVLAKKMEGCKSPEKAYEAAKETGLTDDIESFKAVMTAVNKKIKGELSDEELSDVAGGISDDAAFLISFGVTATAVTAAGTTFLAAAGAAT